MDEDIEVGGKTKYIKVKIVPDDQREPFYLGWESSEVYFRVKMLTQMGRLKAYICINPCKQSRQ